MEMVGRVVGTPRHSDREPFQAPEGVTPRFLSRGRHFQTQGLREMENTLGKGLNLISSGFKAEVVVVRSSRSEASVTNGCPGDIHLSAGAPGRDGNLPQPPVNPKSNRFGCPG